VYKLYCLITHRTCEKQLYCTTANIAYMDTHVPSHSTAFAKHKILGPLAKNCVSSSLVENTIEIARYLCVTDFTLCESIH